MLKLILPMQLTKQAIARDKRRSVAETRTVSGWVPATPLAHPGSQYTSPRRAVRGSLGDLSGDPS